jgi:hypothetical protein
VAFKTKYLKYNEGMIRPLLLLIFLVSCSSPIAPFVGDKSLAKKDAPAFLIDATPRGEHIDDVEYFVKKTAELETYELKYQDHDREVSVSFSKDGKRLETEQDIKFDTLDSDVKEKIRDYLKQRFTNYKIKETEFRTDALNVKFIDVEVSHAKGPTGLTEFTFSTGGIFVSEEEEHSPHIETLN